MIKDFKMCVKFLVRKEYREYVRKIEQEGVIEKVNSIKETTGKKSVMVLLRGNTNVGTFSDYIVFLRVIEHAVEKNYIPVIDRKSVKNGFFPAKDDINTWEVFFEQPLNISLEDISNLNAQVYINHIPSRVEPVSLMHCKDMEIVNYWRSVARRYIRFNSKTKTYIEEKKRILIEGKRTLGVAVREGYIKLNLTEPEKIHNHPRQPEVYKLVEYVEEYMEKWKCTHIFFTCQTVDTEKIFKKRFGNKAICVERNRKTFEELPEGVTICRIKGDNAYENELGYITEVYLLSQCTSFLCSENSGAEAAFIMSNGYENFKCINIGTY